MLGDFIVFSDCLFLITVDNVYFGSPEMHSFHQNPQTNWKLENICDKHIKICAEYQDMVAVVGFQLCLGFNLRPHPRFFTN